MPAKALSRHLLSLPTIPAFWACLLILLLVTGCGSVGNEEADLVLLNGKVITIDSSFSDAEGVAIKDGRIIKVGSTEDVRRTVTKNTKVIDLTGHTVIPGLIEGHAHLVAASQSELSERIPAVGKMDELLTWVSQQASSKKEDEWIVHPKFFFTRLDEMRAPTIEELDAVAPHHPVFLNGSYGGMVNTKALELSDLMASDHEGLLKDRQTGKLNGVILRSAFDLLAFPQQESISFEEKKSALKDMLTLYNKVGITSVIIGRSGAEELHLFEELFSTDELTARLYLNFAFPLLPNASIKEMKEAITDLGHRTGDGDEWIKIGALKAVVDGGVLTGTAFLREPWGEKAQEVFGRGYPGYKGELYLSKRELINLIIAADDSGWNFTAHVTGGGAVDTLLAAFEEVVMGRSIRDKRFSIIHGNFFTEEAMRKMRNLGIYANMQPAWLYLDGDFLREIRGTDTGDFHPYKSLNELGVKIIGGSDHMLKTDPNTSINPYNPFLSIATMVTRKTKNNHVFNAAERLSRHEALKMYTINNAHASFEEDIKGSIEVGKLADLVVLSEDILTCPDENIKDIFPILTLVGGKEVFNKGILSETNQTQTEQEDAN